MQPTTTSGAAPGSPPEPPAFPVSPSTGRRWQLGNWRVSTRLVALVLIPTVFASVLVGLRIVNSVSSANDYGKVEHLGRMSQAITALAHELENERDLTVGYVAAGRPGDREESLQNQQTRVDAAAATVRGLAAAVDNSYGAAQAVGARSVINRLDDIPSLRQTSMKSKVPPATVIDDYSQNIDELLAQLDGATSGVADDTLSRDARSLGAVARLKEEASRQRAFYLVGLTEGSMEPGDLTAAAGARAREESERALFQLTAAAEQSRFFDDTVIGPDVDQADVLRLQILAATSTGKGARHITLATPENAQAWMAAMGATLDRMRKVEDHISGALVDRARSEQDSAVQSAIIGGAIAALLLLLVLAVTFVMARSLVRPLRRLRTSALDVADTQLPALVERLRDPDAAAAGIQIQPVDVDTTDEIGDVARAFDEVHREAVRLAANEAVLRGNINAMFVNLSRRSQSLIERQLRLIDELEQGERDDERLAALFRLDHLATRMRRNCENLLVLGGQDQVRRWNRPVPLLDVVRASLSEVEQYERVQLRIQSEVSIAGPVVNDLVHLVAELVENAISFSPEHTPITVSGHLVSGGSVMLQITDEGVGMTAEELAAANQRLVSPPMADVSVARRMGLFVVGRLAARHNIRVELRATVTGGITAFALLPDRVVSMGDGRALPVGAGAPGPQQTGESWSAFTPTPITSASQVRQPERPSPLAQPIWRTAQDAVPAAEPTPPPLAAGGSIARDLRRDPMLRPAIEAPTGSGSATSSDYQGDGRGVGQYGGSGEYGVNGTAGQYGGRGPAGTYGDSGNVFQPNTYGDGRPATPPGAPYNDGRPGSPYGESRPAAQYGQYGESRPAGPYGDDRSYGQDRTNGGYDGGRGGGRYGDAVPQAPYTEPKPLPRRPVPQQRHEVTPIGDTGPMPAIPAAPAASPEPASSGPWGPLPSGGDGNAAARRTERSPIFEAMTSEWFQARPAADRTEVPDSTAWSSVADEGWQTAEVKTTQPTSGGRTLAGLPKRVPGQNRVPGAIPQSASPAPPAQQQNAPAAAPPPQSPLLPPRETPREVARPSAEAMRARFSGLQRGIHRGRSETASGAWAQQGDAQGTDSSETGDRT